MSGNESGDDDANDKLRAAVQGALGMGALPGATKENPLDSWDAKFYPKFVECAGLNPEEAEMLPFYLIIFPWMALAKYPDGSPVYGADLIEAGSKVPQPSSVFNRNHTSTAHNLEAHKAGLVVHSVEHTVAQNLHKPEAAALVAFSKQVTTNMAALGVDTTAGTWIRANGLLVDGKKEACLKLHGDSNKRFTSPRGVVFADGLMGFKLPLMPGFNYAGLVGFQTLSGRMVWVRFHNFDGYWMHRNLATGGGWGNSKQRTQTMDIVGKDVPFAGMRHTVSDMSVSALTDGHITAPFSPGSWPPTVVFPAGSAVPSMQQSEIQARLAALVKLPTVPTDTARNQGIQVGGQLHIAAKRKDAGLAVSPHQQSLLDQIKEAGDISRSRTRAAKAVDPSQRTVDMITLINNCQVAAASENANHVKLREAALQKPPETVQVQTTFSTFAKTTDGKKFITINGGEHKRHGTNSPFTFVQDALWVFEHECGLRNALRGASKWGSSWGEEMGKKLKPWVSAVGVYHPPDADGKKKLFESFLGVKLSPGSNALELYGKYGLNVGRVGYITLEVARLAGKAYAEAMLAKEKRAGRVKV